MKSHCLSAASLGFLDFLLLLFLYQDKKSKHKRNGILLFRCKPNKIFKRLLKVSLNRIFFKNQFLFLGQLQTTINTHKKVGMQSYIMDN